MWTQTIDLCQMCLSLNSFILENVKTVFYAYTQMSNTYLYDTFCDFLIEVSNNNRFCPIQKRKNNLIAMEQQKKCHNKKRITIFIMNSERDQVDPIHLCLRISRLVRVIILMHKESQTC